MKPYHNLKHIFFDLDHTLWDFDKNSALTYQFVFKQLNINIDLKEFLSVYVKINLELWRLFSVNKIEKETLRYRRLKDTFKAINISVSDKMIHQIADDYILNLSKQTHLFEGTIKTLTYLQSKYQLHIITNGFADVQVKKIKNSKLKTYFKVVLDSETATAKKPNPIIFEKALQLANATTENSLMIGDNYEADIQGALNFGMDAICFNYHQENLPENIKIITHLEELIKIL